MLREQRVRGEKVAPAARPKFGLGVQVPLVGVPRLGVTSRNPPNSGSPIKVSTVLLLLMELHGL